ncbi:MAG: chromophore lyase CpcT/CpeT [Cyanobacteria bacterium P01_A01_bin.84]
MRLRKIAIYLLPILWLTTLLTNSCTNYANKRSPRGDTHVSSSMTKTTVSSLTKVSHALHLSKVSSIKQSREIASWLEGKMETSIPSSKSQPKKVRITTCRISLDRSLDKNLDKNKTNIKDNSIFLYQEQAMVDKLSKPYRQRFLQISSYVLGNKSGNNSVNKVPTTFSVAFKPKNLQNWINFCNKKAEPKVVKYTQIGEKVCTVTLHPADETYIGKTPSKGCPAKVRGAVRITNSILLRRTGMETWDRGFNAEGKQVWGAKNKPYYFQKVI